MAQKGKRADANLTAAEEYGVMDYFFAYCETTIKRMDSLVHSAKLEAVTNKLKAKLLETDLILCYKQLALEKPREAAALLEIGHLDPEAVNLDEPVKIKMEKPYIKPIQLQQSIDKIKQGKADVNTVFGFFRLTTNDLKTIAKEL